MSFNSNSDLFTIRNIAEKIKLDYISLGLKPLPFGFQRAIKKFCLNRKQTAIVGDQIFTDILGGNFIGLRTILLTPIKPETTYGFRFKRWLEKIVFKVYKIKNTEV